MYYTVIKHSGHLRTLDKCRKHSPAARAFYIYLVFSNDHRVLSQCNTWLRLLYLLIESWAKSFQQSDWSSGSLYKIFGAWLLSSPPLPSRQVNMADSCEWIFRLFGRHRCKSRIFERMENFQNDCCRPWAKTRFKNSCSRQLRIVNAVVSRSPAGQIDWPKSVFLRDKVTLFETMMTTMNEVNRDKTKVPD